MRFTGIKGALRNITKSIISTKDYGTIDANMGNPWFTLYDDNMPYYFSSNIYQSGGFFYVTCGIITDCKDNLLEVFVSTEVINRHEPDKVKFISEKSFIYDKNTGKMTNGDSVKKKAISVLDMATGFQKVDCNIYPTLFRGYDRAEQLRKSGRRWTFDVSDLSLVDNNEGETLVFSKSSVSSKNGIVTATAMYVYDINVGNRSRIDVIMDCVADDGFMKPTATYLCSEGNLILAFDDEAMPGFDTFFMQNVNISELMRRLYHAVNRNSSESPVRLEKKGA